MAAQMQTAIKAIQSSSLKPANAGLLQRQYARGQHAIGGECEECRRNKGMPQRASIGFYPNSVPPEVHEVLRSPGQPLDASTRALMGLRFGFDFSQVRIHADANAAKLAKKVNALAYTIGNIVVFGERQYAPATEAGLRLLSHELTHVVQQKGEMPPNQLTINQQDSAFEKEANQAEALIASAFRTDVHLRSLNAMIARKAVSHPIEVRTPETLEEYWQWESDDAWSRSEKGTSKDERAFRRRLWIMLNWLRPNRFLSEAQLIRFLERCHQTAQNETATLKAAEKVMTQQQLLENDGMAFPRTWADKIFQDFRSSTDITSLHATYQSERSYALKIAIDISDEVLARGLPLSVAQARTIQKGEIVTLILNFEMTMQASKSAINLYARSLLQWLRAGLHYSFVKNFESSLRGLSYRVRIGELVIDSSIYKSLEMFSENFYRRLRAFENAFSTPEDLQKTFRALDIEIRGNKFFHDMGHIIYRWPSEGIEAFLRQLQKVDQKIAGESFDDSIRRAFTWAHERNFFSSSGLEVWESIKKNGWKMLAAAVGIIVLQFIPGVNVALDTILIIEFGLDALITIGDLAVAFKKAGSAKSVVMMENASAKLAETIVGTGAKIILWAIAFSGGKLANKMAKWRRGQSFLDRHGNSPEARKALAESKGDIAKAERSLVKKQERLEAASRQQKLKKAQRLLSGIEVNGRRLSDAEIKGEAGIFEMVQHEVADAGGGSANLTGFYIPARMEDIISVPALGTLVGKPLKVSGGAYPDVSHGFVVVGLEAVAGLMIRGKTLSLRVIIRHEIGEALEMGSTALWKRFGSIGSSHWRSSARGAKLPGTTQAERIILFRDAQHLGMPASEARKLASQLGIKREVYPP